MAEQGKRKTRFRVIKTYPTEDRIATCKLSKYLGGKTTRYRRLMEKWLYLYEQEQPYVHFKVWNTNTKICKICKKRNCNRVWQVLLYLQH